MAGVGFQVWGLGLRVQGSGLRVEGLGVFFYHTHTHTQTTPTPHPHHTPHPTLHTRFVQKFHNFDFQFLDVEFLEQGREKNKEKEDKK